MNRIKLLLAGLLVAIPLLGFSGIVHAHGVGNDGNATVPEGITIDHTYFVSGRSIDIDGTVDGDVICAGQSISITGTINGDVICAGQSIDVSGDVKGDVRLAGQNVTLGGTIAGNASIFTQGLTTKGNSSIGRDLSVAGESIVLNGSVLRDISASATTVTINNAVGRNINTNVDNLTLGSLAKVTGNVDYTSNNKLERDSSAVVDGQVSQHTPAKKVTKDRAGLSGFLLYLLLALLIAAMVLVLIMPRVFQAGSDIAVENWGRTLLIGIIASIIVPVLIAVIMITIIGIPLAILLFLAWAVVLFLSGIFSAYLTGRIILRDNATNAIGIMLLGALVLLLIYFLPFVGGLVALVAMWFGIGMILQLIQFRRPNYAVNAPATTNAFKTRALQTKKKSTGSRRANK